MNKLMTIGLVLSVPWIKSGTEKSNSAMNVQMLLKAVINVIGVESVKCAKETGLYLLMG